MLSQGSEDEMWSRFVFELVIWPKEVTLVSRTQPSGPLCLWQCFIFPHISKEHLWGAQSRNIRFSSSSSFGTNRTFVGIFRADLWDTLFDVMTSSERWRGDMLEKHIRQSTLPVSLLSKAVKCHSWQTLYFAFPHQWPCIGRVFIFTVGAS